MQIAIDTLRIALKTTTERELEHRAAGKSQEELQCIQVRQELEAAIWLLEGVGMLPRLLSATTNGEGHSESQAKYLRTFRASLESMSKIADCARSIKVALDSHASDFVGCVRVDPVAPADCKARYFNRIGITGWECLRPGCAHGPRPLPQDRQWPCGAHPPAAAAAEGVRSDWGRSSPR